MQIERNQAGVVDPHYYFATPVFITKQPQFLDLVKSISLESLKSVHGDAKLNEIYPVRMSGNLLEDERIASFAEFVGRASWDVLDSQGYAMDGFNTTFTELWCQEHYKTSSMEYHVHPGGNYIVGFYFLDVPENCPHAVVHDPRPGRMMIDLPQKDVNQVTLASTMINFKPEPGMMMFAPAWLAHSFGRNPSDNPFRFIHFNISVIQKPQSACKPQAEIV